ncbi:MAG: right-handed parallel beta-helix repeat-containing protein [Prevotellaceae bacterium]|nr:right-handed parallel beta-helix repeat-containing protein [Prevotellaceae bacterium]
MLNIKNLLQITVIAILFSSCNNACFSKNEEQIGAYQMPYTRYDSQQATLGGLAVWYLDKHFDRGEPASEATNQEYAALITTEDFVSWKINNEANGVTIRFTLPDNASTSLGDPVESVGQRSDIDIFVNDKKVKTVTLDSRWAWQYFIDGDSDPKPDITDYEAMRFDEVHFLLENPVKKGDIIKIKKSANDNLETGIDFIEIENVPEPLEIPANALSVKDFGAKGDGVADDWQAIKNTINAAVAEGKTVYIPAGTYRIDTLMKLDQDGINIQGAGMWHTNLYFSNNEKMKAAVCGNASRLRIADLHINGVNMLRQERDRSYRDQKGIWGNWGESSIIENVWIEHFECGIWTAGYAHTPPVKAPTNNLIIRNVRLRNMYADGVNLCEGTSNSVFEHSNVRNCGDDGIASWSQTANPTTPPNSHNIFRYNTVELGWRAGAIGIFGGSGHQIYNCYAGEHSLSAGIRFTADFPGNPLDTNPENAMKVKNCIIYKCGTKSDLFHNWLGAIDIHGGKQYPLNNISFENIKIIEPQTEGIHIWSGDINNLSFKNVEIIGSADGINDISIVTDEWQKTQFGFEKQGGSAVFQNVTNEKFYKNNENFEVKFKK